MIQLYRLAWTDDHNDDENDERTREKKWRSKPKIEPALQSTVQRKPKKNWISNKPVYLTQSTIEHKSISYAVCSFYSEKNMNFAESLSMLNRIGTTTTQQNQKNSSFLIDFWFQNKRKIDF